jgi:tetratricopeptide (TPR) repeat protein
MSHRFVGAILFFSLSLFTFADEGHQHQRLPGEKVGRVHFPVSCAAASKAAFEQAVAKLHSFWYEEAEGDFNAIAAKDPACTMAYWGVAMSNFHPIWYPPNPAEAQRAQVALAKAKTHPAKTARERAYVDAISDFYAGYQQADYAQRLSRYTQAMEQVAKPKPNDSEATIFYALALRATASPTDKTLAIQKRAGAILEPLFLQQPQHPGLAHYIIHSYDYSALAPRGLEAARAYAKIAPSVPHALHMPSHIFIRLGLWEEAARSNEASAKAGREYEVQTKMPAGTAWDQHLHALDYLEYAYLQMGQYDKARQVLEDVATVRTAQPDNTTAGYARAAIPARYWLEQANWKEAAKLAVITGSPETQTITLWARSLGAARSGNLSQAKADLATIETLRDKLRQSTDPYPWHYVVEVQRLQAAAWIAHAEGRNDEAIAMMHEAAELEDKTDKSPVTPGSVLPGHELLADLLMDMGRTADATKEYEATLRDAPNRRRSLEALDRQRAARK